ncbi:hypothetical protein N9L68_04980 [bacterium]|nr:hypothetical protein [bacterium]
MWDDSGRISHPREAFGDIPETQLLKCIDKVYRFPTQGPADAHLDLVDDQGRWTSWRHPENDRGDEASEEARESSVDEVGIVPSRGGPWLVAVDKDNPKHASFPVGVLCLVLHWASLLSGARRSWLKDVKKENRVVHLTVREGVDDCRKYHPKTPTWAIKFLVHMSNIVNNIVTGITILQVYRSTVDCERAFNKAKQKLRVLGAL